MFDKPKIIINPKQLEPAKERQPCELCTMSAGALIFHVFDEKGDMVQSSHYVCSLCFLYESPWGKSRVKDLDATALEIEASSGERFLRSPAGRLALAGDADKVVFSIAIASELLFAMHRGEFTPDEIYQTMIPAEEIKPAQLSREQGYLRGSPFTVSQPAGKIFTDSFGKD